jgi:hypothetical protein
LLNYGNLTNKPPEAEAGQYRSFQLECASSGDLENAPTICTAAMSGVGQKRRFGDVRDRQLPGIVIRTTWIEVPDNLFSVWEMVAKNLIPKRGEDTKRRDKWP